MRNLPDPPSDYDQTYQTELNRILTEIEESMVKLDGANYLTSTTDSSGNVAQIGSIILQSPDGTFYKLTVANGGAVTGTAVTTGQTTNPYVVA